MLMKVNEAINHYINLTKPGNEESQAIVDRVFPAKLSLAISRNVKRL